MVGRRVQASSLFDTRSVTLALGSSRCSSRACTPLCLKQYKPYWLSIHRVAGAALFFSEMHLTEKCGVIDYEVTIY